MKTGKILAAVLLGTFLFQDFALFADNAAECPLPLNDKFSRIAPPFAL
jgi:hypothetical protein